MPARRAARRGSHVPAAAVAPPRAGVRAPSCRHAAAPGDLEAQAERAVENLREALAAEGAGFDDVVKATIYVVGEERADLVRVWNVVSPLLGRAPNTLLGVSFLGYPDQLVEIEAVAY